MKEIFVGIQPGPGRPTVWPVRRQRQVKVHQEVHLNGQEAFYIVSMDEWRRYNDYKIAKSQQKCEMSGNFSSR